MAFDEEKLIICFQSVVEQINEVINFMWDNKEFLRVFKNQDVRIINNQYEKSSLIMSLFLQQAAAEREWNPDLYQVGLFFKNKDLLSYNKRIVFKNKLF